jgi:hypothetical protein
MTESKSDPKANPAASATTVGESPAAPKKAEGQRPRARIPMHSVRRKLEVPEIPGYRLYWFLDINIPAALQAYYEFVGKDEVEVNQFNPGNDENTSGNIDLGNRVRLYAGPNAAGHPEYFTLMKLKKEHADDDAREIARRNAQILEGVFKREQILGDTEQKGDADLDQRYVKPDMTKAHIPLFLRKVRKV